MMATAHASSPPSSAPDCDSKRGRGLGSKLRSTLKSKFGKAKSSSSSSGSDGAGSSGSDDSGSRAAKDGSALKDGDKPAQRLPAAEGITAHASPSGRHERAHEPGNPAKQPMTEAELRAEKKRVSSERWRNAQVIAQTAAEVRAGTRGIGLTKTSELYKGGGLFTRGSDDLQLAEVLLSYDSDEVAQATVTELAQSEGRVRQKRADTESADEGAKAARHVTMNSAQLRGHSTSPEAPARTSSHAALAAASPGDFMKGNKDAQELSNSRAAAAGRHKAASGGSRSHSLADRMVKADNQARALEKQGRKAMQDASEKAELAERLSTEAHCLADMLTEAQREAHAAKQLALYSWQIADKKLEQAKLKLKEAEDAGKQLEVNQSGKESSNISSSKSAARRAKEAQQKLLKATAASQLTRLRGGSLDELRSEEVRRSAEIQRSLGSQSLDLPRGQSIWGEAASASGAQGPSLAERLAREMKHRAFEAELSKGLPSSLLRASSGVGIAQAQACR